MDNAVKTRVVPNEKKASFDWKALFMWFFALVLSLVPIAIVAIERFLNVGSLGDPFLIELFTKQDTLWAFATLLAVSLANIFLIVAKGGASGFQTALLLLTFILVILVEACWFICKYAVTNPGPSVYWIGFAFCGLSLLLSLPIQVSYIKKQGGK